MKPQPKHTKLTLDRLTIRTLRTLRTDDLDRARGGLEPTDTTTKRSCPVTVA